MRWEIPIAAVALAVWCGSVAALAPGSRGIAFEPRPLSDTVLNGAKGEKHLVETMIAGVAAFDYDGDGWADIFIANGGDPVSLRKSGPQYANHLLKNQHDGTFADVTAKAGLEGEGYSMGVAAADFDNDGNVDLFVTGVRGNHLYRNRGDGAFEDVTAKAGVAGDGEWSAGAVWFDYDNDGLLDLLVIRYVKWQPAFDTFCGVPGEAAMGKAEIRQYCNPRHYEPLSNVLYRNVGNGRFEDVSARTGIDAIRGKGMGAAIADYDGDGKLDIFIANDSIPNALLHNEGGKFRDLAMEAGVALNDNGRAVSAMGVDFRDVDNDGREDIFFTALPDETFPLFRNLGAGHFADVTYASGIAKASVAYGGWSAGIFDFDNDGRKDIFAAGGHVMDNAEASSARASRNPNLVFRNTGGARFEMSTSGTAALHRGAAFADFNHDGLMDAVVTRLNEPAEIYWNRTRNAGHWIGFRLRGTTSNRPGIGAMVHLTTASGEQWNRVTTAVGYAGSSDRTVHFGLGPDSVVRRVEIVWPSAAKQVMENVAADRVVDVTERR